ncbi:hypothetical protein PBI_SPORTO_79 [Arthrobacter phage Sporto]|nr:hypothetical protein PBI_SPORTO_79 [Arthrobacter phage Sporto]
MPNVHIIFGTDLLKKQYVDGKKLWGQYAVLATQPERLTEILKFHKHGVTIVTVRYPKSVWEPSSHPCGVRMRETEQLLAEAKRLGVNVLEVEIV